MKNKVTLGALAIMVMILTGCADTVTPDQIASIEPVGFWYGLWHGFILPIAWIVSLFSESTAIYAVYNNGGWYDFGFIMGVGVAYSGSTTKRGN